MRILQVFEPPDGGVPEHVLRLGADLARRGHSVEAAGPPAARSRFSSTLPYHDLPFVRSYRNPANDLSVLTALYRLAGGGGFDLVHAHSSKAGALARPAARAAGKPCIYTPHCYSFIGDVSRSRRAFGTAAERALGPLTGRTICVCRYERHEALRHSVAREESLAVVHNGVDPCVPGEPDPELRDFAAGNPLIGIVAVHRRQKGLDRLLESAASILRRRPDVRFAIVGEGPLRAIHERRAHELGVAERVRFADFGGSSRPYLSALDVFVHPSRWEAFPIGVLEAMSCGTPVVATDVGGVPEALEGGAGILVPNWDPDAFAQAIGDLVDSPTLRSDLGSRGRQESAKRFTISRMAAQTMAVYEEVLGRPGD